MINSINQTNVHPQNFLSGFLQIENQIFLFRSFSLVFIQVHERTGIDASSSPSPQSNYSPQSSPSESRTSPNVNVKNMSNNHKYAHNPMPLLTSVSQHNDLPIASNSRSNRSRQCNFFPSQIIELIDYHSNLRLPVFFLF